MSQPSPFGPALFDFFRELAAHNERPWFEANRDRYEDAVLTPSKTFVLAFRPHLKELSPHFQAEPRIQGGSLFRIHNNLRFNPNRPPYKTHAGIQFRHTAGGDVHAPGFYLHLEPGGLDEDAEGYGGCFVGMGIWRPDRAALQAIREAIVDDPDGWRDATGGEAFREHFEMGGESLKLGPVGFDRDHPLIDDIKRKDFIAVAPFSEDEVVSEGFVEIFAERCRQGSSLVRWLCGALAAGF